MSRLKQIVFSVVLFAIYCYAGDLVTVIIDNLKIPGLISFFLCIHGRSMFSSWHFKIPGGGYKRPDYNTYCILIQNAISFDKGAISYFYENPLYPFK